VALEPLIIAIFQPTHQRDLGYHSPSENVKKRNENRNNLKVSLTEMHLRSGILHEHYQPKRQGCTGLRRALTPWLRKLV
jgi:hypothetical protein